VCVNTTTDVLFNDPASELRRLESFLRVPHYPYAKSLRDTPRGTKALADVPSKADFAAPPPMNNATAAVLRRFYAESNRRVKSMLGLDVLPGFNTE
jgi:hypothetical protein